LHTWILYHLEKSDCLLGFTALTHPQTVNGSTENINWHSQQGT
jgi:hypothetical protein